MVRPDEYAHFDEGVRSVDAIPLVDEDAYRLTHHLPNWYPLLREFTAETAFISADANLPTELAQLGRGQYFLKDYVKSLKADGGSIVRDPADGARWLREMLQYRDELEGGICIRRVEQFVSDTNHRNCLRALCLTCALCLSSVRCLRHWFRSRIFRERREASMNVVSHHSEQQLQRLADREPRAELAKRLRTVLMAQQGFTAPEVAICTGFSPRSVQEWVARYNREGLSGLATKPGRGRKPSLTPEEAEQLKQRLDAGPLPDDGVCTLRGKDVQLILQHEFGQLRSLNAVYDCCDTRHAYRQISEANSRGAGPAMSTCSSTIANASGDQSS